MDLVRIGKFIAQLRKEHIAIMTVIGFCIICMFAIGIFSNNIMLVGITPLILILAHAWRNNTMMNYVENNIYGSVK